MTFEFPIVYPFCLGSISIVNAFKSLRVSPISISKLFNKIERIAYVAHELVNT